VSIKRQVANNGRFVTFILRTVRNKLFNKCVKMRKFLADNRMKVIWLFGPIICLLFQPTLGFAKLRPSFNLDRCTWNATDVVVVTEGEKIDGELEVLEVWKGNLKKGERISVPDLAAFAPDKEREVAKRRFEEEDRGVRRVTCSRMILFLIRQEKKDTGERSEKGKVVWIPADEWGGLKCSTVWVEQGNVYAFAQQVKLIFWDETEVDLKKRFDEIITIQTSLAKAIESRDKVKLADSIPPLLLRNKSGSLSSMILDTIGKIGPDGLPALHKVLQDDTLTERHTDAVWAMQYLGPSTAGPALTEVLKEELAYWKTVAPMLKKGWWNGVDIKPEEMERLRSRYNRVYYALQALRKLRSLECRDTVRAFRDYWQSLPQLGGEVGQISRECDDVLEALHQP